MVRECFKGYCTFSISGVNGISETPKVDDSRKTLGARSLLIVLVVASLVAALIIILSVVVVCRRRQRNRKSDLEQETFPLVDFEKPRTESEELVPKAAVKNLENGEKAVTEATVPDKDDNERKKNMGQTEERLEEYATNGKHATNRSAIGEIHESKSAVSPSSCEYGTKPAVVYSPSVTSSSTQISAADMAHPTIVIAQFSTTSPAFPDSVAAIHSDSSLATTTETESLETTTRNSSDDSSSASTGYSQESIINSEKSSAEVNEKVISH